MANIELRDLSKEDLEKLMKQIQREQKVRAEKTPQKLRVDAAGVPEAVAAIKAAASQHGVRAIEVVDAALRAMKLGYDIKAKEKPQAAEGTEPFDGQVPRRRGRQAKAT